MTHDQHVVPQMYLKHFANGMFCNVIEGHGKIKTSHLANDLSQAKNNNSDFTRIGKEFHRWIRDNSKDIGLNSSDDYVGFIDYIAYYSKVYSKIYELINDRNTKDYLYLVVNSDYGFTLQPAVILATVKYQDSDEVILEKLKIVSKFLTKVLSWRVWNHWVMTLMKI